MRASNASALAGEESELIAATRRDRIEQRFCCTCSGLQLMWWTAPAPGDESP